MLERSSTLFSSSSLCSHNYLLRTQERPATLILTVISFVLRVRAMFITGTLKPEIEIFFCKQDRSECEKCVNRPFCRYGGHIDFYCFERHYGMLRGLINMYLPPEHPIIANCNNRNQNGRRICKKVYKNSLSHGIEGSVIWIEASFDDNMPTPLRRATRSSSVIGFATGYFLRLFKQ